MTRVSLLALVLCAGCTKPHLTAAPVNHHGVNRVILSNDLPGDAELCVQLPESAMDDTVNVTGPRLACWGTVGDLRVVMVQQQRAN